MGQFNTTLCVEELAPGSRRKVLLTPLVYQYKDETLTVPPGFICDGYSVPTGPWVIVSGIVLGGLVAFCVILSCTLTQTEAALVSLLCFGYGMALTSYVLGDPWGKGAQAAILHDYIGDPQTHHSSRECDIIFRDAMRACEVTPFRAMMRYLGVRAFKPIYRKFFKYNKE